VDPAMPERYDVPILLERMRQLAPYREEINRAIGQKVSRGSVESPDGARVDP
jgi:hypothetical protein